MHGAGSPFNIIWEWFGAYSYLHKIGWDVKISLYVPERRRPHRRFIEWTPGTCWENEPMRWEWIQFNLWISMNLWIFWRQASVRWEHCLLPFNSASKSQASVARVLTNKTVEVLFKAKTREAGICVPLEMHLGSVQPFICSTLTAPSFFPLLLQIFEKALHTWPTAGSNRSRVQGCSLSHDIWLSWPLLPSVSITAYFVLPWAGLYMSLEISLCVHSSTSTPTFSLYWAILTSKLPRDWNLLFRKEWSTINPKSKTHRHMSSICPHIHHLVYVVFQPVHFG